MIPYTTIPFVSAFFLVLVGVLIGQLFWTRFRSDHQRVILRLRRTIRQHRQKLTQCDKDLSSWQNRAKAATQLAEQQAEASEGLRGQLESLRADHQTALGRLTQEHQARRDLVACLEDEKSQRNRDVEKLNADLLVLQANTKAEFERRVAAEDKTNKLEADILSARRECDQLQLQLREQTGFAAECQIAQREAEQHHAEILRQAQLLRERIHQVEHANDVMQREMAVVENENRALLQQLEIVEQSAQDLQSQLRALQVDYEHLNSQQAEQELIQSQTQHKNLQIQQQLNDARQQLSRLSWEFSVSQQRCSALQAENEQLAAQLIRAAGDHQDIVGQLESSQTELLEAQRLAAEHHADFEEAIHWRVDAERMVDDLVKKDSEIAKLVDQIALLQGQVSDLEARHIARDVEHREQDVLNQSLSRSLREQELKAQHWESLTEKTRSQIEEARREIERLSLVEDQLVELDAEYRQVKDELKQIRRERDDTREIELTTRKIVAELKDELNERLDAIEVLRRDREAAVSQLEFEQRQRKQVEDALAQAEGRLSTLQNENDGWSQRQAKLVAQATELTQQIQQWQAQSREFEERSQRAERQVAELASQLDSQQQLAEKLRRRRFASLEGETPGDSRVGFSFRDMRIREQSTRDEDDSKLVAHEELGKIFDVPPQRQDDLKKIPGIADRVEEQLYSLGIYTYRQMMEWNRTIIAEISRRLELGDLIQREDWVGHARRLYHEHERNAA